MKVIFLDIDGVMNSHVFFEQRHKKLDNRLKRVCFRIETKVKWVLNGFRHKYKSMSDYETPDSHYTYKWQIERLKESTCPQKWEWLSEWCNENDVKVCISSTWRNHFGDRYRRTPDLWDKALTDLGFKPGTFVGITTVNRTLRGEEIKHFVDRTPTITDYAILDDDSDMLPEQFVKFHHCDGWFGLSPNHLHRINRQFNGENTYKNLSKTV